LRRRKIGQANPLKSLAPTLAAGGGTAAARQDQRYIRYIEGAGTPMLVRLFGVGSTLMMDVDTFQLAPEPAGIGRGRG
jgi:hypothetical protein